MLRHLIALLATTLRGDPVDYTAIPVLPPVEKPEPEPIVYTPAWHARREGLEILLSADDEAVVGLVATLKMLWPALEQEARS